MKTHLSKTPSVQGVQGVQIDIFLTSCTGCASYPVQAPLPLGGGGSLHSGLHTTPQTPLQKQTLAHPYLAHLKMKTYQPQTLRPALTAGIWFNITEPKATRKEALDQIVLALNQDKSPRPNPKRILWFEDGVCIKEEGIWSHGIPFPVGVTRKPSA